MSDLQLLFDNKLASITVDDFLDAKQTSALLSAITKQSEWQEAHYAEEFEHLFTDLKKPMHLFSSQYMVASRGVSEDDYLALCKTYQVVWNNIVADCGFDPFISFINYIKNTYKVNVELAAKKHATYAPLVARDLSTEVLPHADYGPYDGKGWVIDQVKNQIAWNIYLSDPGSGGETTIYDRVWQEDDTMDESSYGIKNFVAPIKKQFTAAPGRLVLFNSRNFHAITKSSLPRIAIGGLLGQTMDGKIIAWS